MDDIFSDSILGIENEKRSVKIELDDRRRMREKIQIKIQMFSVTLF